MSLPPARSSDATVRRQSSKRTTELIRSLQETVDELKTDILMLTRKVVSLEAELDHVQGRRAL